MQSRYWFQLLGVWGLIFIGAITAAILWDAHYAPSALFPRGELQHKGGSMQEALDGFTGNSPSMLTHDQITDA